jgi:hypothetical protein
MIPSSDIHKNEIENFRQDVKKVRKRANNSFLNDFEKAEYEDSEQKLQKQGITTRRYGSGYDIEEPTVAPQSTPTQGDIQGK